MPLRVRFDESSKAIGGWVLPPRALHAASPADAVLGLELERYLRRLVRGRSFLIAGHRGSGKTTFVSRMVDSLNRKALGGAIDPLFPQRPIAVPLHGPGLIGATAWGQIDAEEALRRIAEGLYRALAAEAAECFRRHAALADRHEHPDALEVATALSFDLDSGPDAALLRQRYAQIGRLEGGVLWPAEMSPPIERRDQGFREILALATAAQVYRVCSGAVTYAVEELRGAKDESALKGQWDHQPQSPKVAGALASALGGTLAGAAALTGGYAAVPAVAVGLGAAFLTNLAVTFSFTRSRSAGATTKHEFIRDTSVASLERDLPILIERVRDAGLAPVFIVDELDKVDDTQRYIPALLKKTKHIVADNAFFCFLTDRSYFETIDQNISNGLYPMESTYFSHRLIVTTDPRLVEAHLLDVITLDVGEQASATAEDAMALPALAGYLPNRGNYHHFDIVRILASIVDQDGIIDHPERLLDRSLLISMILNYKIVDIMNDVAIRSHLSSGAVSRQRLLDTATFITRCWVMGHQYLEISDDTLISYLIDPARSGRSPGVIHESDADAQFERDVRSQVERLLAPRLRELQHLLLKPAPYVASLAERAGNDPALRSLLELARSTVEPLLEEIDGTPTTYRFRFDPAGLSWGRIDWRRVSRDRAILSAVAAVLEGYNVQPLALATGQFLPPTPTWDETMAASALLAERHEGVAPELQEPAAKLHALADALIRQSAALGALLATACAVAKAHPPAGKIWEPDEPDWPPDRIERCVEAILRYVDLREGPAALRAVAQLDVGEDHPDLDPERPDLWSDELLRRKPTPAQQRSEGELSDVEFQSGGRWRIWRERLGDPQILRGRFPDVGRDDLVFAALRLWPAAFLRRDMARIGPVGWTRLAVAASTDMQYGEVWPGGRAPTWALVPSLSALGAGQRLIQAAVDRCEPDYRDGWERLVSAAGGDRRVFVIEVAADTPDDAPVPSAERTDGVVLALPSERDDIRESDGLAEVRIAAIDNLLGWLQRQGVEVIRLKDE